MESIDELDCQAEKTGAVISRDDAHLTGAWHGAFHCLVVYERKGRQYALFQKRSSLKKVAPGKFDVSVGGHYSAGEDAAIAGPREIREELGFDVAFRELVSLGRRIFVYCFTPGIIEHEFQDVFLLHKFVHPQELTLQAEEVDGLLEMDLRSGILLFSGKAAEITCLLLGKDRTVKQREVSAAEFVPCLDNYYLKLLLLAKRYFNGETRLLVI